jgi:hypothetical protein
MLKNKLKISLIVFMLLAIVPFTLTLADDEENSTEVVLSEEESTEATADETETTEETDDTDSDSTSMLETLKEYYTSYYASYLGDDATSGDIYKVDSDIEISQSVAGNVFVMGNNVNISSETIHGDVYVIGTNVTITAYEITGSVYVMADTLTINNTFIDYSLYVCANTIDFYGASLDMYASADTITIQANSCIQRDLHSTSNVLNLYGAVCRNAYSSFTTINWLTSEVSDDETSSEETDATEETVDSEDETDEDDEQINAIFGNFEYTTSEEIEFPDYFVGGEATFTKAQIYSASAQDVAVSILESAIFMMIIFAVLALFAKKFTANTSSILANNLGKVILKGILCIILIPVLAIALFLLGITIKAAFVLLGIYLILLSVATSVLIIALSKLISNKLNLSNKAQKIGAFILVALIYAAILQIPYVGAVIAIAAGILGFGIIVQSIWPGKVKNTDPDQTIVVTAKVEKTPEDSKETKAIETSSSEDKTKSDENTSDDDNAKSDENTSNDDNAKSDKNTSNDDTAKSDENTSNNDEENLAKAVETASKDEIKPDETDTETVAEKSTDDAKTTDENAKPDAENSEEIKSDKE